MGKIKSSRDSTLAIDEITANKYNNNKGNNNSSVLTLSRAVVAAAAATWLTHEKSQQQQSNEIEREKNEMNGRIMQAHQAK